MQCGNSFFPGVSTSLRAAPPSSASIRYVLEALSTAPGENECVALNQSRVQEYLNIATKVVDSRFVNIAASSLAPRAANRVASLHCCVTRLETGSCSYKTSA